MAFPDDLEAFGLIGAKQTQVLNVMFQQIVTAQTSSQLVSMMQGFEHGLAARTDITNADKELIFLASSLAKRSAPFWEDAQFNSENPWFVHVGDNGNGNGFPKWLSVLLADVGGALIGAVLSGGNICVAVGGAGLASGIIGADC